MHEQFLQRKGSCGDGNLAVTGTIKCGSKTMNLGIAGITGYGTDTCKNVFPALDNGLLKGQVLDFTVTTEGTQCTGPFVAISDVKERYCNSGEPSVTQGRLIVPRHRDVKRTTNPDFTVLTTRSVV